MVLELSPEQLAFKQSIEQFAREVVAPRAAAIDERGDDSEALIVHRGELAYVVLNAYPYNPGHMMVVPFRHVSGLHELRDEELVELTWLTQQAVVALRESSQAEAFNIGMNLGAAAGAGIADHLHQHVVPRWTGDTNFMPVVGQTRVLPQLLADSRAALAAAWPKR